VVTRPRIVKATRLISLTSFVFVLVVSKCSLNFFKKGFHLSLNLFSCWFLRAIYFSVFIIKLIKVQILSLDKCLGLSIWMNSFIIFSLIKVEQEAPPKSKIFSYETILSKPNFFSSNMLLKFFQAICEKGQSHKRCLVVSLAPHLSHSSVSHFKFQKNHY
jgi:hypothetical protein